MSEFDDPFKPSDSTVIRPRPGAGRRGPSEPASAPPRQPVPAAPAAESLSAASLDAVGLGLGPLLRAASPLLLIIGQLRGTITGPDIHALRRHALDEIRRFEDRARAEGIANEIVLTARYALCAALDEAVLSTPWGAQSEWTQQSLLVALHREAWGGEKFFEVLDRISREPARHIDLMEVQYLCLALGFAGKYHVEDRGHARLLDIQHDLFRKIREYRGPAPAELSPRWQGIQDRRNPLVRYVPWWVVGVAVLAIVLVVFTMYRAWLAGESTPVAAEIGKIATKQAPAVLQGRGLEPYLKNEVDRQLLTVSDNGAKVTLTDVFASGSDRLAASGATLLGAVCQALDHFPNNPVQIIGHTDDQPVKGKFMNNMVLSQKRAEHVAGVIKGCLKTNSNRVTSIGRGDLEAFRPDSGPGYREKSRRVEIVLGGS
jgi:type VI secretion system protein ImpK